MDISLVIPVLLGWLSGWFVNYTADVLPLTRRFGQPACPHCQATRTWADFLTLRPCRTCGKNRSLRTWLVQFLGSASFVYFWLFPSEVLGFPLGAVVLIYFAVLVIIDLEHRLILHTTSLAGAVLGLIVGTYIYYTGLKFNFFLSLGASLLGGLIGFGVMFLLYQVGAMVARLRARRMQAAGQTEDDEEALGGGDVFLLGVLGLMVGYRFISNILVQGVLLGGLVSIVLIILLLLRRRYASDVLMTFIPYGPYFIFAAFNILFL
jgi:leader peptidase (prepilin peptidase) / N-methyltransferase